MKGPLKGPRHGAWWLLVTIVALIIGSVLLDKLLPLAARVLALGSTVIAVVVLAHIGGLAMLMTSLVALRRRSRRSSRN